jgi:hypothetical protein
VLVGEKLRPVPVLVLMPVPVPVPVQAQAQVELRGVVDPVERIPESTRHHPERAVVPDRGYS